MTDEKQRPSCNYTTMSYYSDLALHQRIKLSPSPRVRLYADCLF